MTRGIDIISRRFSAFEKKALQEILDLKKDELIYELGSGQGNFSLILAFLNKRIISWDINFQKNYWKLILIRKIFKLKNLNIEKKDLSKISYKDFQENISFIFAGRFLHYLKYQEAEKLLKILKKKTKSGARLYFSISAIDTDLGKNYPGKNIEIEERFFRIDHDLRKRFQLEEKVCLYTKNEVKNLFEKYFKIIELEKTAFGNINIIVEK